VLAFTAGGTIFPIGKFKKDFTRVSDLQVYFDGGCPVCSREIAVYRSRPGAERFEWVDITRSDADLGPGLTPQAALARMHVRTASGKLLSGAEAFAAMWRRMPGLQWLGWLLVLPPFGTLAERAYRGFLVGRKLWR
jgi:predicted DCC family thiol-disulfide oxidoreductase YuxK